MQRFIVLLLIAMYALLASSGPASLQDVQSFLRDEQSFKTLLKHKLSRSTFPSFPKDDPIANIESYFTTIHGPDCMQVPAYAFTIVQNGAVLVEKAYGAATTATIFGIGSCTKALTSFVVGSLQDDGILTLETPIRDVIPNWYSRKSSKYDDASVEDALTHRLGLSFNDNLWFFNITTGDALQYTHDWQKTFPPIFPLRSVWQYFNFGYSLAGAVASASTGKSIETLFKERIFTPLGLTSGAYATTQEVLDTVPQLYADPYYVDVNNVVHAFPRDINTVIDGAVAAAGSVQMSISAVSTYLTALQNQAPTLVSSDVFSRLTSPRVDTYPTNADVIDPFQIWWHSYGYGWVIGTYRGQKFLWHNGQTVGHTTMFLSFPDQGLSIGVLTNMQGISGLTHFLFGIYAYDELMGNTPIVTPDIACDYSVAVPVSGAELYAGLPTTVNKPHNFIGKYHNIIWKTLTVSLQSHDTLLLTVGDASGLLYAQDGTTFSWFGENWPEPDQYTAVFNLRDNTVSIDLNIGYTPIVFKKQF